MSTNKRALIFAQNPQKKGFFFTSDDQAFELENDAINHGKTLDDKKVKWEDNPKFDHPASPSEDEGNEMVAAQEKYLKLFAKTPPKNAKLETLLEKIATEEARINAEKEAEEK